MSQHRVFSSAPSAVLPVSHRYSPNPPSPPLAIIHLQHPLTNPHDSAWYPHKPPGLGPRGAAGSRGRPQSPQAPPSSPLTSPHLAAPPAALPATQRCPPQPGLPLIRRREGRIRGAFLSSREEEEEGEPFLCAGKRGRAPQPRSRLPPPHKPALLCHPPLQGFKNNRHGGGNSAMTGSRSVPPRLPPHGPLGVLLSTAAPRHSRAALAPSRRPSLPLPGAAAGAGAGNPVRRRGGGEREEGAVAVTPSMVQYPSAPEGEKVVPDSPELVARAAQTPPPEYLRQ